MKKFLLTCSFLFLICSNRVDAATETVNIYSHQSDGTIVTGPYPSSWITQYFSTIGRDPGVPTNISVAYTDEFNSSQGYIGIYRSFLSFDTSVIPDDAVITSAKINVTPDFVFDEYDDQYSYMNVLEGRQASATALTLDDIEKCGDTLENPAKGASDVDISGIVPNTNLPFSLNETGKGWISKTGYTKICIREGHDIENKETVNNANYWRESGISYFTSEALGTSTDPYLEITYEVPDVPSKDIYDLLRELIVSIEGYAFPIEITASYDANLKKVEGFLNSGKYLPAENQIRAFIKKLEQDYLSGKITHEQYNVLLNQANLILEAIPNDGFGRVPLMTQIVSPYPSLAETTSWADVVYANGRADKPGDCGRTIAQCGCAITSLSMIGNNYGLTSIDGAQINPLLMNNWLLAHGGYSYDGGVMWNHALAYMGEVKNGKMMSKLTLDGYNETDQGAIGTFIEKGYPSLGFSAAKGHYVVLTGTTGDGYSVNDPLWYNTNTTDDTRDVSGKVQDYNNVIDKANLIAYSSVAKPLPKSVEILLESPAELLITDGKGRRLGYDPVTGEFVSEIPGGSYNHEDFILNPENPSPNPHKAKRIYITNSDGDVFDVQVIGTGEGEYHLTFDITDGKGGLFNERFSAETSVGDVDGYTVVVRKGKHELPQYLQDILSLIPAREQKKFIEKFAVISEQTEKGHVFVTERLVRNLIHFIEEKYEDKEWAEDVVEALQNVDTDD